MKNVIWFAIGLVLCSGCFAALLVELLEKQPTERAVVTIQEIEAGKLPAESGTSWWRVTGGVWLVDEVSYRTANESNASYRPGSTTYYADIPYASSAGVPIRQARVEGSFRIGKSPEIDPQTLGDPEGFVYLTDPERPGSGPKNQLLHPAAIAVIDWDRGKLTPWWTLALPVLGLVVWTLIVLGAARSDKKRAARGETAGAPAAAPVA